MIHMKKLYLGIDTSCYTTSLAAAAEEFERHYKTPLSVKPGERGLRQSDAVFMHLKNMPALFEELQKEIPVNSFDEITVSVSSKPRSISGSYMPVFTAGQSFARAVCAVLNASCYEFSHQDGHIMAAIYSCGAYSLLSEPFLAFHLSGGTTELLLCRYNGAGFDAEIVGGTLDLPAGQLIDRTGVMLGLDFPCGIYLDTMACEYEGTEKVHFSVKDTKINFSGEETRYKKMAESGDAREKIAYMTMETVRKSVMAAAKCAMDKYNVSKLLMAGGVSASKFLREGFAEIEGVYFAAPELSTDNAMGICMLGKLCKGEL